jgi:hypothetical protein
MEQNHFDFRFAHEQLRTKILWLLNESIPEPEFCVSQKILFDSTLSREFEFFIAKIESSFLEFFRNKSNSEYLWYSFKCMTEIFNDFVDSLCLIFSDEALGRIPFPARETCDFPINWNDEDTLSAIKKGSEFIKCPIPGEMEREDFDQFFISYIEFLRLEKVNLKPLQKPSEYFSVISVSLIQRFLKSLGQQPFLLGLLDVYSNQFAQKSRLKVGRWIKDMSVNMPKDRDKKRPFLAQESAYQKMKRLMSSAKKEIEISKCNKIP